MRCHRKTSPRVKHGRVQRKNRNRTDVGYARGRQIAIERVEPCDGYRHYVTPADVTAFLSLLPDWDKLSIGLERVLLDCDPYCDGWHYNGTVAICASEERPQRLFDPKYFNDHAATFRRLKIPCLGVIGVEPPCSFCPEPHAVVGCRTLCCDCAATHFGLESYELELGWSPGDIDSTVPAAPVQFFVDFNDDSLRAYLLIHVLVHELGHHHDRMTSPKQRRSTRGEKFAESYALRHEAATWEKYRRVFRMK